MSPTKTAATPYFLPIRLAASASSWLRPTAASTASRLPSSMKRVPGCAAWTCSWSCCDARAPIAPVALELNSITPSVR